MMVKFYEDNAGFISAVVCDGDGKIENVVSGCEQWTDDTPADVIAAAKKGLPYCRYYNSDDYCGATADELAAELADGAELIAEITPESVELYPDDMGIAGRRLFGVEG